MSYGIGIDTGGTYTDAVLYDYDTKTVLSHSKSLTTRDNLKDGIIGALRGLDDKYFDKISLVALSTTLATNACVEGKGCRAKLIMLGCEEAAVVRFGADYGLPAPADIIMTDWGLTQEGELSGNADWDALEKIVTEHADSCDAFALVAQWGMKNPAFERAACERIEKVAGKRVICACDLSNMLNIMKRAATALLNARLIPIIDDFLRSVKIGIYELGINAPAVIVGGDGSLMSEEYAAAHPVETLFSGPASSVTGGIALSGQGDCVVVDVGGTTTDMAIARNGSVEVSADGLSLGGFRTCTRAVRAYTIGLGGDSMIRHDREGGIEIGPRRSVPLSCLAHTYPETLDELRLIRDNPAFAGVPHCEFLILNDKSFSDFTDSKENLICKTLKNKPKSVGLVAFECGFTVYEINRAAARLERQGVLLRAGLTPTDIMHIRGIYTPWNVEAALCGCADLAFQLETTAENFCDLVYDGFSKKIFTAVVKMLLSIRENAVYENIPDETLKPFIDTAWSENSPLVSLAFTTGLTLVGIGAPTYVFLPAVAQKLACSRSVPLLAEVANAYGAVTGNVLAEAEVEVAPIYTAAGLEGYRVFTGSEPLVFDEYGDALETAKAEAMRLAGEKALKMGAKSSEVFLDLHENQANVGYSHTEDGKKGKKMLLGAHAAAKAVGRL